MAAPTHYTWTIHDHVNGNIVDDSLKVFMYSIRRPYSLSKNNFVYNNLRINSDWTPFYNLQRRGVGRPDKLYMIVHGFGSDPFQPWVIDMWRELSKQVGQPICS